MFPLLSRIFHNFIQSVCIFVQHVRIFVQNVCIFVQHVLIFLQHLLIFCNIFAFLCNAFVLMGHRKVAFRLHKKSSYFLIFFLVNMSKSTYLLKKYSKSSFIFCVVFKASIKKPWLMYWMCLKLISKKEEQPQLTTF